MACEYEGECGRLASECHWRGKEDDRKPSDQEEDLCHPKLLKRVRGES